MDVDQRVAIEKDIMSIQAFAHAINRMLEDSDTGEDCNLKHHPKHRLVSPDDLNAIQFLVSGIQDHGEAAIKAAIQLQR